MVAGGYTPPPPQGGSGVGGTGSGRGIHQSEPEYGRTVYYGAGNTGYLHRYREEGGIAGTKSVVGTRGGVTPWGLVQRRKQRIWRREWDLEIRKGQE